jgi:hypothetical protein
MASNRRCVRSCVGAAKDHLAATTHLVIAPR